MELWCSPEGSRQHREGSSHGISPQNSTQERRKLLKRTRSLAVISEDEARACRVSSSPRLGSSCDSSSLGFDPSSLQWHRPYLIPRAKLIDRNSLKDSRLSKSQQHLYCSYDRFTEAESTQPYNHSRSACGLYSLPSTTPALNSLPYVRSDRQTDRLNILKWPDSPRRYRSVQDLNTVTGLVEVVEDTYWPAEGNRSIDCIYTQVKRKRKEHRSLDSILFEDDSDELEYFDVLNLLPLSNVRLEIKEPDVASGNVIQKKSGKEFVNQESQFNPSVISVSTKKNRNKSEQYLRHCTEARITDIKEITLMKDDKNEKKIKKHSSIGMLSLTNKKLGIDVGTTSFPEIAKEKRQNITSKVTADLSDLNTKSKVLEKDRIISFNEKRQDVLNLYPEEISNNKEKPNLEETEDTKSLWISDNEEAEDMSRRPQVLKIIDNDITKPKDVKKSVDINVKTNNNHVLKENICKITTTNKQTFRSLNQPDLINDHVHKTNNNMENCEINKERISVENARTFFEKKNIVKEPLPIRHSEGTFERIVKETSNILGKACNAVKGSLGFEARSDSSDLGLGSDIGSDVRRLSVDENTNAIEERIIDKKQTECKQFSSLNVKNQKNCTNLTRSRSCIDSIECQDTDEPEFDHVRYKIVKSNVFSKSIFNNSKKDVTYDGLIQYLQEYSFQDLLMDNNVVIIEPVRAEVERKPSLNESKNSRISMNVLEKIKTSDLKVHEKNTEKKNETRFAKTPRQSSLRKHFFYQPIRVNRELNDDELPNPDTVRNVRKMFEETMKGKLIQNSNSEIIKNNERRMSVSMKDLRTIENRSFDSRSEKAAEEPRSRCSSRAKDLTKMFENLDKTSPPPIILGNKDDVDNPRNESKTRTIAQSFEARSGHTSPSDSNSSKARVNRFHHRQLHNWDAGSVSSGVSSEYPDTDAGSAAHCTSSEDEELYCNDDDGVDERYEGHYVSQDVLKKIRECGTTVTYYGGKVVNTSNRPLICPMVCKQSNKPIDYVKFRLVKSNSCDSRLELTGRVVDNLNKCPSITNRDKSIDLRQFTIDETPSIEITPIDNQNIDNVKEIFVVKEEKREPPVVIGLEPKKDESKTFKTDFQLGMLEDCASINRFTPSALTRWQINENAWKRTSDFGKMEFEEFEVLEDSLNGVEN